MPERTVVVASGVGLHARPAALFVQLVAASGVDVTVGRIDEEPVAADSILAVLSLGVRHGERVVLTADADGADDVLDELVALLSTDHDAE